MYYNARERNLIFEHNTSAIAANVYDNLSEQNRNEKESDHIVEKMRYEADQTVSGPAVQYRKKYRVCKYPRKIPRSDACERNDRGFVIF